MKKEYIIVDKTAIQKRIEELKPTLMISDKNEKEISTLERILSQSIPLIPEIEKAFEQGRLTNSVLSTDKDYVSKQDYISNLNTSK